VNVDTHPYRANNDANQGEFKTVRLVYFDEAGSSSDEMQEPIIAVASIVVHGDLQTGPIERDAEEIIATQVPVQLREKFEFHAKELFSGSDKLKGWRREERYATLAAFIKLVVKHNLPVHYSGIRKAHFWNELQGTGMTRDDEPHFVHEIAFLNTAITVEMWFKEHAAFERGFCVADETKAKDKIKNNFRDNRKRAEVLGTAVPQLAHLIDSIYFGDSHQSIFLQLADCCAFFIKRTMMERPDAEPFYKIIEPQVAPKPLRLFLEPVKSRVVRLI
jgi:Protein of unknown function (DUF3800)